MEAVRAFNNELSSLYETKPPISRAKMAQLTKCAIKAIKFYKHVVQSVEKFIQKCKPDYKVPGLYVIDSVVRQSRHQFGANKDVFAPRFTKNIIATFQNLFKCPGDERSKIVRVLNLWQKNDVFPSEIIQPLLDLAADPTKPSALAAVQAAVDRVLAASGKSSSSGQQKGSSQQSSEQDQPMNQMAAETMLATQNDMLNTVTQLLQQTDSGNSSLSAQQQQLQQLQLLQQQLIQQTQLMQQPSGGPPLIDSNLLAQIQTLTNQLLSKTEPKAEGAAGGFNTKLLDFDYGESDDDEDRRHQPDANVTGNVQTILNDSGLMQQIHQMSQNIQQNEQLTSEISEQERRRRILEEQQAEFDQQISQGMHQPPPQQPPPPFAAQQQGSAPFREEGEYEEDPQDEDFRDHQQLRDRDEGRGDRRRDRRRDRDYEKSRSRSPKRRRRSRSRSRDRRRRSRSRDRPRRSRSRDREREKQREKERERKKKALPPIRDQFITVCSTTIWIGHLNKFTSEEELRTELEHYGPVGNINMVPPRGCAYIVMMNRKDANKAIDRLKGFKLNSSALKTAWAQSQGIRESSFKDSWDVEHGAIYIPWDSLPADLSTFLEGSIIDSDTLPEHLKDHPTEKGQLGAENSLQVEEAGAEQINPPQPLPGIGQAPLPGQPPMMGMMGGMAPNMTGMMPGMMMPMQRPMVPGMPPQPMGMPPGAPPQMMPPSPVPGMRPPAPGVNPSLGMSIANTATSSLAQNIQIMATAALMPGSPGNRPTFTNTPPRFGFNPNLPPPGFRLPPPGFPGSPMRPPLIPGPPGMPMGPNKPPEQGQTGERPPLLEAPPKQPEMAWPPDSNEKDEDLDEEEEAESSKPEGNTSRTTFQGAQFAEPPSGPPPPPEGGPPDQKSGPHMPLPPDGFPPGFPPGPNWNMLRMPGMRNVQPGPNNQGMFNSRPPLIPGGPRGPMFMNSPGFPRFPPGGPPPPPNTSTRPPVSLLDLDIKPPDRFDADRFKNREDDGNRSDNEKEVEEDLSNVYPFNSWQTATKERSSRGRDGDWSRDRESDRDRDKNSHDDGHRDRRDRDRHRDRDRDNDREWRSRRDDRNDRNRDRDRGDRDRHDRSDRDRDRPRRDRDRSSRSSRWSNIEDDESKTETDAAKSSGNPLEAVDISLPAEVNPVITADPSVIDGAESVPETTDNQQTDSAGEDLNQTPVMDENSMQLETDNSVDTDDPPPPEVQPEVNQISEPSTTTSETVSENCEPPSVTEDHNQEISEDAVQETPVTEMSVPNTHAESESVNENGPIEEEAAPEAEVEPDTEVIPDVEPEELPSEPVKKIAEYQEDVIAPESNGKVVAAVSEELEEGEIAS